MEIIVFGLSLGVGIVLVGLGAVLERRARAQEPGSSQILGSHADRRRTALHGQPSPAAESSPSPVIKPLEPIAPSTSPEEASSPAADPAATESPESQPAAQRSVIVPITAPPAPDVTALTVLDGVPYDDETYSEAETGVDPAAFADAVSFEPETPQPGIGAAFMTVARRHPAPLWAWLETIFWSLMLLALIDHALGWDDSFTGTVVWFLTIGPHELGHLVCMPFGRMLSIMGGSIWQIFWWAGLAVYVYVVHQRISMSLLLWTITGHSFINLSPYIADASDRDLPLLFALDESAHDWGNILEEYGLLHLDGPLATTSTLIGVGIVLLAVVVGLVTTWLLPRSRFGPQRRIEQLNLLEALRAALDPTQEPEPVAAASGDYVPPAPPAPDGSPPEPPESPGSS
ncbi:MAG: hypothetical protein GYB65_01170 [Chloroflexi bacterium]|nr:hypothetical protein [Chloroflexota bacterium]